MRRSDWFLGNAKLYLPVIFFNFCRYRQIMPIFTFVHPSQTWKEISKKVKKTREGMWGRLDRRRRASCDWGSFKEETVLGSNSFENQQMQHGRKEDGWAAAGYWGSVPAAQRGGQLWRSSIVWESGEEDGLQWRGAATITGNQQRSWWALPPLIFGLSAYDLSRNISLEGGNRIESNDVSFQRFKEGWGRLRPNEWRREEAPAIQNEGLLWRMRENEHCVGAKPEQA